MIVFTSSILGHLKYENSLVGGKVFLRGYIFHLNRIEKRLFWSQKGQQLTWLTAEMGPLQLSGHVVQIAKLVS